MWDLSAYLLGLAVLLAITTLVWLVSLALHNASIIDPVWPLLFLAAVLTYASATDAPDGDRRALVVALVAAWAVRLGGYLTWRAWGKEEDYRYQAMRRRAGDAFPAKSLFTVFWLQAVLAWIVSLPLLAAVHGAPELGWLDWAGGAVFAVGWVFEAVGDAQLARFKADPGNQGRVMDQGLWRYTRHPNYFGNFMMWWGLYLIGLAAGGWWAVPGPLLMSFLLLRVSGVAMLERTIGRRRPGYDEYVAATNAFFPGPPRRRSTAEPPAD